MLRSFFENIIKYFLLFLENIGLAAAKLAFRFAKLSGSVYFSAKDCFLTFAKRWRKTLDMCAESVKGVAAEVIKRTKRNAQKYGKLSGFYKLVEEIIKNTVRNKQFLFKAFNYTAPFFAIVIVFFIATSFNNVTLAYEVKYDGDTIGYVSDEAVISQASNIVKDQVEGSAQLTTKPVLNVTLVSQDKISNANDLSEKIIETSGELTDGCGLYVNDKFVLAAKNQSIINFALVKVKDAAQAATKADSAEFVDNIELKNGTYCDIQLMDSEKIEQRLSTNILSIKTVKTQTKTEVMKYSTITAKDNTKYDGYKRIAVKGSDGEVKNTVETTYINGAVQSTKMIDTSVTKAAIDEQIIVGTRKVESNVTVSGAAKFSWPVERVASSYVSQYYGHEGHTGLDIAAYSGTQIYAAGSGIVTEIIKSDVSYGNHFKVDCGNGIVTMYAHCSEINVEVGDVVTMGDKIAKVGSTGNSTGPHLHFEVIVNGVQVNPGSYVGIN